MEGLRPHGLLYSICNSTSRCGEGQQSQVDCDKMLVIGLQFDNKYFV